MTEEENNLELHKQSPSVEEIAEKYIQDEWSKDDEPVKFGIKVGYQEGYKQAIDTIVKWVEENNHTMGESESPKFVYMGNLLNYINSLKK